MSLKELDTENADRDITSLITVLTHTPTVNGMCIGLIKLGDGTKNLDGTGGDFQLVITVGGQTVEPSPQTITFSTAVRGMVWTTPFPVVANDEVIMRVLSPNAADTDVDVTAYLYDSTFALPDAACDAAGGLLKSDAGGLDMDTLLGYLTGNVALNSTVAKEATLSAGISSQALDSTVAKDATVAKDSTVAKDATVAKEATAVLIRAVTDLIADTAANIVNGAAATGTLSTTEMTTDLTISVDGQLNGRIILFKADTATVALRNVATDIQTSLIVNGKLTFTAIPAAPANGDTFSIV